MRTMLYLFMLGCASSALATDKTPDLPDIYDAEVKINQLTMLDHLIEATTQNLENEKQIKALVSEYLKLQSSYLKSPKNQELAFQMVKVAHQALEKIKEANLIQAFDPEFIGELNVFSQIAMKRTIPNPN